MNAIIYACTKNGLANRLRALIGYQALAHFSNAPFYLYWQPNASCNASFNSLFKDTNINLIDEATFLQLKTDLTTHIYNSTDTTQDIWRANAQEIVTWDLFRDKAHQLSAQLRPIQAIADIVEPFSRTHTLHNLIGVHIRHTDNVIASETVWISRPWFDPNKVSSIAGFVQYMTDAISHDPTIRFFVATDHSGIERLLLDQFPNHILVYPKTYLLDWPILGDNIQSREARHLLGNRTSAIQDALIEMLLLGRCKMLIGTKFSSFSQFAALWGNIPLYLIEAQAVVAASHFSTIKQVMPNITLITGMHRSGTSMVTQALYKCGINLGNSNLLMNLHPSNPDGHFELLPMKCLNDDLLKISGGSWDHPPITDLNWEDEKFIALYDKASQIIQQLTSQPPTNHSFGIKDPRLALTLPFWQRIFTYTHLVVCIRHPIEVALSLQSRNAMPIESGLELWLAYNHRLLALSTRKNIIFTHYHSWLRNSRQEINRIVEFLGLCPSHEQLENAITSVKKHYHRQSYLSHNIYLPVEIVECYQKLCELTSEICQINYRTYVAHLEQHLAKQSRQHIQQIDEIITATQQALAYYRERVAQLEQDLIKQRQQQT